MGKGVRAGTIRVLPAHGEQEHGSVLISPRDIREGSENKKAAEQLFREIAHNFPDVGPVIISERRRIEVPRQPGDAVTMGSQAQARKGTIMDISGDPSGTRVRHIRVEMSPKMVDVI